MSKNNRVDVSVDEQVLKDASPGLFSSPDLIGSIDQGTSSTRFLVFTALGRIAASAQMEHEQIFPSGPDKVGWHEHDPLEIWANVVECIQAVADALKKRGTDLQKHPLKAVGITNQRETTIAWNATTGVPYHNAIVWDDLRTNSIVSHLAHGNVDKFREKTGLPLASYFAGTKVKWLLDNVPQLQADLDDPTKRDNVRFGTVDTWVVYQLTGKASQAKEAANKDGVFITDVTNASRWLFLDIHKLQWDETLVAEVCAPHSVPLSALPTVRSSSEVYATCRATCGVKYLDNVPIASILGDQQAALFGQCGFEPGEAKCTYGTGLFLMMNTGTKVVPSTQGLLTTVAYQVGGKEGSVKYALEGSVSHSGSTIQWLRDQLGIISKVSESETWASKTESNHGLYFVPAFAGLFAPHWRADARACIVGMTATHTRAHICRAALEASAYQTREVFDAVYTDSKVVLKSLKVDGGGTHNDLLMQFQADIINVDVVKPVVMETTAIGAAFAAGLAVGVWKELEEIRALWAVSQTYKPSMTELDRERNWNGWKKAITKSLDWIDEEEDDEEERDGDSYATADEGDKEATAKNASKDRDDTVEVTSSVPVSGYGPISLAITAICAVALGYLLGRKRR